MKQLEEKTGLQSAPDELAATKLAPLARDEGQIIRQDLMDKLNDVLRCRLTIVHGAAGYGKTSLLVQWFKAMQLREITAAWLTLEEDESSPATCMSHVLAALAKTGYIDQDPMSSFRNFDDKMSANALATAFINTVAEKSEPLAIFLDEYNRVQSDDLNTLFKVLVRNIPRHVHFIIAARWRPEIELENLRVRDDLVEVTAQDLRFSQQEAESFFAKYHTHLTDTELRGLTDRTEGWPIALQMARLWFDGNSQKVSLVSDFSGRTSDLARYLTEQVLSALAKETRAFLMETSILSRINGDVANAVTGRHDGWLVLEELYERDLFLVPESNDRQWFRYHSLFLDYLRDCLERYGPDAISELHSRAAAWLAAEGYIRSAVHHALKAGDSHFAAKLLSDAGGWRLIMDGRINLIRTSIAEIPDTIIRGHVALFLAKSFLLVKDGDVQAAREYFYSLEKERNWAEQDKTDWDVMEHILADYADKPASIADIEWLNELKQKAGERDHVLHAILSDSLATKYYEFGLFEQSLEASAEAIGRYRNLRSLYGEVFLRFTQAKAHLAQGRLEKAESILRATEKELSTHFGDEIDLATHTSIYLSEIFVDRHQILEAVDRFPTGFLEADKSDSWFELYATAFSTLAAVEWDKGGVKASLAVCDRMRRVAQTRKLDRLALLGDCLSVYYLFLDDQLEEVNKYYPSLRRFLDQSTDQLAYRFTGILVVSCAMILIVQGNFDESIDLLAPEIEKAKSKGDLRQLINLRLMVAIAYEAAGKAEDSAYVLNKAVQDGVFTGILRPYVDFGIRLQPIMESILNAKNNSADRFRDNFLRTVVREVRRAKRRKEACNGLRLTAGELEVLQELDHGYTNKEIAQKLNISPNTVKYRMKGLFVKLGVSVRKDAVRVSRERALLQSK